MQGETPGAPRHAGLLEELEDGLGLLVRLGQHGLGGLHQHVHLGVVHHFLGHIGVTDTAVGGGQVLNRNVQVVDGVLQTVLEGTQVGTLAGNGVDGVLDGIDGAAGQGLAGDLQVVQAQALGAHVGDGNGHLVVVVGGVTDLEGQAAAGDGGSGLAGGAGDNQLAAVGGDGVAVGLQGLGQVGDGVGAVGAQGDLAVSVAEGVGLVTDADGIPGVDLASVDGEFGAGAGAGGSGGNDSLQLRLGVVDLAVAHLLADVDGGGVLGLDDEVGGLLVGKLVHHIVNGAVLASNGGQVIGLVDADLILAQGGLAVPLHKGEGLVVDGQGLTGLDNVSGEGDVHTGAGAVHLANSLGDVDGVVVNSTGLVKVSGSGSHSDSGTDGIVDSGRLGGVNDRVHSGFGVGAGLLGQILKVHLGAVRSHLKDSAAHIHHLIGSGKAKTGIVGVVTGSTGGDDGVSQVRTTQAVACVRKSKGECRAAHSDGGVLVIGLRGQRQVGHVDAEGGVDLGNTGAAQMESNVAGGSGAIGGQGQLAGEVSTGLAGNSAGVADGEGLLVQAHGAIQQLGAVEVGGLGDSVDLVQQLIDLGLEGVTLGLGVGAVGGLGGQLHHTVQHGMNLSQVAFGSLDEADAILGVGGSGLQTGDLGLHLLADGQTGSVITGTVDAEARGQLLQRLGDSGIVHAQLTVSVQCHCVSSYDHSHCNTSIQPVSSTSVLYLVLSDLRLF